MLPIAKKVTIYHFESHVLLVECDFVNEQCILGEKNLRLKVKDWGTVITSSGRMKFTDPLTVKPKAKDWLYLSIEKSPIDLFWRNLLFTYNLFVGRNSIWKPSAC